MATTGDEVNDHSTVFSVCSSHYGALQEQERTVQEIPLSSHYSIPQPSNTTDELATAC